MAAPTTAAPQSHAQRAQTQDKLVQTWKDRIQRAKDARKPEEPTWLSNLAFAAGKHWLVWDEQSGQMRHIQQVDPTQRDRVLYTADRINEYLRAQEGELNSDDDRPELLTAQDGDTAEEIARELNQAVAHGWDHEWQVTDALNRARRSCLVMGVAALRMRFDPTKGPVTDHQPVDQNGQPVEPAAIDHLEANGMLPDGSLPRFQPIHEGRSVVEPYTAFQILSPPGVVHEDDFPWEVLVRPALIDDVQDQFPDAAGNLTEDTDIQSAAGLTTGQTFASGSTGGNGRLRDHVWLYTCFRRPCRQYPNGQTVILASNSFTLLHAEDDLPYRSADGTPKSGIVYLHWWRLDDRFWSRAFIQPLKDPQRIINETETVNREIFQRGLPKVIVKEGAIPETPQGAPLEILALKDTSDPPIIFQGITPNAAMYTELEHQAENLAHASTLSQVRIGENPPTADTYSALVLLNENDGRKRDVILSDHRRQVGSIVEFGVHDIRQWWGDGKLLLVTGDEGEISRQEFQRSKVPDFFIVKWPSGAAAPRSQAAEVKKIDAIWAAAVQAGVVATDPDAWTRWYAASLAAGEPLELPEPQKSSQREFAAFENFLMRQGEEVEPMDYDLLPEHLPEHREAQDEARAAGDMELVARIQRHVDSSVAVQQVNAAKVAAAQQAASPLAPAGPPDTGGQPQIPAFVQHDFNSLAGGN